MIKKIKIVFYCSLLFMLFACGGQKKHDHGLEFANDKNFSPDMSIVEKWKHLKIIDIHNHSACCINDPSVIQLIDKYYIDKTVLFGNISDPDGIKTDQLAWAAYQEQPEKIIPFFAAFEMEDLKGIARVEKNIEKGYFGVGEVVAASYYSPAASTARWKAQHPMYGNLPKVYELCSQHKIPILLHIDPLDGPPFEPMQQLEVALSTYPTTQFILGHVNAYNNPENVRRLLQSFDNIYMDFFAGFTAYNPESDYDLNDWVGLIKEYPDRFMVSTDSGYGVGLSHSYYAIYLLLNELDDDSLGYKIAHENFMKLIQSKN